MSSKVEIFVWLLMNQRLVVNEYRVVIGAVKSDMCDRCQLAPESLIHLFRDCPFSRQVWDKLILTL